MDNKIILLILWISLAIGIISPGHAALNWQQVPEIPTASTIRVYLHNDSLYCGTRDLIYRYDYPENKWDTLAVIDPDIAFIGAIIKVDNRLFAGSFNMGVFESTDNGLSWTPRNSGLSGPGSNFIIDFARRGDSLYVGTLGAGVYTMNLDGSSVWSHYREGMPDNIASNILSLYNHDNVLLSGAGYNSTVYRNPPDTNGWTEIPFSDFDPRGAGMLDMTSRDGLVYGAAGNGLYISPDSGVTWARYNVNPLLIAAGAVAADQNQVYGSIYIPILGAYYFSSTGDNWVVIDSTRAILPYDLAVLGGRLYSAREDGLWSAELNPSNSNSEDRLLPNKIQISQNYPNPFNSTTLIDYSTPSNEPVTIEVFNLLGQKVKTLVNEIKTAGSYRIEWSGDNDAGIPVSTGIYLYRIKAANNADQDNAAPEIEKAGLISHNETECR